MAITITIQAASDSAMTENGTATGTPLADDDLRKVYGLPNQYIGYKQNSYCVKCGKYCFHWHLSHFFPN